MLCDDADVCNPRAFGINSVLLSLEHFASGAIGLTTSFALVHPLDTLRTQMQAKGASVKTVLNANNARALLRGFGASVIGAAPQVSQCHGCVGIGFSCHENRYRQLFPSLDTIAITT